MSFFLAELFGTLLLILLGDGVVANVLLKNTKGNQSGWIVISAGWGFAVAIGVYLSYWISGGHLNPAVTLGLAIAGVTPWKLLPLYLAGQFLGAFLGAVLVWLTYYSHFAQTKDETAILLCFSTKPAIRNLKWNFMTEAIGTAVLLIGVFAIFNPHMGIHSALAPYIVGILIFSIGLSLGGPTGYAINPARDFGPRLAHALLPIPGKGKSDWGYAWVPVAAPLFGGVIGALAYRGFLAFIP